MRHYHITAKGVSTKYNMHNNEKPVFGLEQGTTDLPAKGNVTSNTIIQCHNKWAIGIHTMP
eukprot:13798289-Ditylum_brightwellii.AAC.2